MVGEHGQHHQQENRQDEADAPGGDQPGKYQLGHGRDGHSQNTHQGRGADDQAEIPGGQRPEHIDPQVLDPELPQGQRDIETGGLRPEVVSRLFIQAEGPFPPSS